MLMAYGLVRTLSGIEQELSAYSVPTSAHAPRLRALTSLPLS